MLPLGLESTDLWICDSPGFGDSGGVQIDIANGVGTINAIKECESVKVAVILPRDSLFADRMAGAVAVSQVIANLFADLKAVLPSIVLLFNIFKDESEKKRLLTLTQ